MSNREPKIDKPPIGIMPRLLWEERCANERLTEIMRALADYRNVAKPVPRAWLQELSDLIGVEPETAPPAAQDASSGDVPLYPTPAAYEAACRALEDWKKRARRWYTALLAIAEERSWKSPEGSSVAGPVVIAKYAICDCWKHGHQDCEFCRGEWGKYLGIG